ncbi:hypothetical protein McpSp1_06960 [Methanocorpusculaceae archaeon Sp1]|nr:hypothetical protein [Methanocorpusculaceae archaeon Sp1]
MRTDNGISPVIAVVVLIGLVVIASAIIGLTMLATMENVSGTPPDVRFQVSADGVSLYHAGGDALPLRNLIFYDTSTKKRVNVTLIKGGGAIATSGNTGDNSFDSVWETGDKIRIISGKLSELSIVGPDSRNHPALLYMGANAMVLPIGDMVPDEWIETVVPVPTVPPVPPVPPVINGDFTGGNRIFNNLKFGENLIILTNQHDPFKYLYPDYYNYTGPISGNISISLDMDPQNARFKTDQKVEVVFFNQTGVQIGDKITKIYEDNNKPFEMPIYPEGVIPGDWCYITFSGYIDNHGNTMESVTIIIRMGSPAETG